MTHRWQSWALAPASQRGSVCFRLARGRRTGPLVGPVCMLDARCRGDALPCQAALPREPRQGLARSGSRHRKEEWLFPHTLAVP